VHQPAACALLPADSLRAAGNQDAGALKFERGDDEFLCGPHVLTSADAAGRPSKQMTLVTDWVSRSSAVKHCCYNSTGVERSWKGVSSPASRGEFNSYLVTIARRPWLSS
jgi:hypothetical protein